MNPRIYKKRAKLAVQLLRSYGDLTLYDQPTEPGWASEAISYREMRRIKRMDPARYGLWQRISGIPETFYKSFDGEWDGHDACEGWRRSYYDYAVLPHDFFEGPEWDDGRRKPWPYMTTEQRRSMWRHNQIAPGWRWRGGRAVKVAP